MNRIRRALLSALIGAPALGAVRRAGAQDLALTPACDDDAPTIAQTEGPYFTPDSPLKQDFAADSPRGQRVTLAGFALDAACRPLDRAVIELWHCDEAGVYDNAGHRLRGHQFTDAAGGFRFDTIAPGVYPGRTRHYHVKIQRPGGRVLTTQLYFPGESGNARDGIFDDRLLVALSRAGDLTLARFDFVLA